MKITQIEKVKSAINLVGETFTASEIAALCKLDRKQSTDILHRLYAAGHIYFAGWRDGLKTYTTRAPEDKTHKVKLQPGILGVRIYKHDAHGNRIEVNG